MTNNHINYVEFKAKDLEAVKKFYSSAFGWEFTDYGPEYVAFNESGLEGGFMQWDDEVVNGALIILYHSKLEEIKETVIQNGGEIIEDIFSFLGGRRFHFADPAGNHLAIWSDK